MPKKSYTITIRGGELSSPELDRDLKMADGLLVDVTIEKHGDKARSVPQNSYLWGIVYEHALKYYQDNPADFIRDLMVATKADINKEFLHELFKLWFNSGKSTTKLSTEGMSKYWDGIREWFFHKHGKDIPEPNQEELTK